MSEEVQEEEMRDENPQEEKEINDLDNANKVVTIEEE